MKEEKIKVLALLPMELPKEIDLDNTLFLSDYSVVLTCPVFRCPKKH